MAKQRLTGIDKSGMATPSTSKIMSGQVLEQLGAAILLRSKQRNPAY